MKSGNHPFWLCRKDSRFSYCFYVPETLPKQGKLPVIVAVHGSHRVAESYRNLFADLAEKLGAVVLAPLFPCGIEGPEDTESYKFCITTKTRFDLVLLSMVSELNCLFDGRLSTERLALFGYSGGGQFAHRFAYLHADKLAALSIGAPGKVTLMDQSLPWWRGLAGLDELVGQPLSLGRLKSLPVQLVIGEKDNLQHDVKTLPDSPHWMDGINDAGSDRIALMKSLHQSLRANGVVARLDIVEGVGHDGFAVLEPVFSFFSEVLRPEAGK